MRAMISEFGASRRLEQWIAASIAALANRRNPRDWVWWAPPFVPAPYRRPNMRETSLSRSGNVAIIDRGPSELVPKYDYRSSRQVIGERLGQ